MDLEKIKSLRMSVNLDSYYISIWELLAKYKDNKINLSPNFQRYFKWDKSKKSHLIESILIWIPLPSIFVYEDETLNWQIIDWLQRIATILEFFLKLDWKEILNKLPPIKKLEKWLTETDILWMEFKWKKIRDFDKSLSPYFINYKLHIFVIKESWTSNNLKFKLFQRLNTWWEKLNEQEIRNAYLIENNENIYNWLILFWSNENFKKVARITKSKAEKSKNLELIIRALVISQFWNNTSGYKSINYFIDNNLLDFITNFKYWMLIKYNNIIEKLYKDIWIDVFNWVKKRSFSEPIYDTIIVWALNNYDNFINMSNIDLKNKIINLKSDSVFIGSIWVWPSVIQKVKSSYDKWILLFS